jgi:excisionase family DNA binding protein
LQADHAGLLTIDEACAFLRLKPRTLHKLVRLGRLGCVQVTQKERRFTREQLDAYVVAQTIAPKNVIDRKTETSLPLKTKGGENRRERRVTRVSEPVSIREEIRRLCQ